MPARSRLLGCGLAIAALLVLTAACSTSPAPVENDKRGVYLSIGDSYAAGFRPAVDGKPAGNTTDGFAWRVADATGLRLVNFACSGITAVNFMSGPACADDARAPNRPDVEAGSEAASLSAWLDDHADDVHGVTVVLGGNDVISCGTGPAWATCAEQKVEAVRSAVGELVSGLRAKVGADVPIIGLTYADVLVAESVLSDAPDDQIDAAIALFRDHLNPALEQTYRSHDARFADVTQAFGAYIPAGDLVDTPPWGEIPRRAAEICRLTYYCSQRDIHPNAEGHQVIADLVIKTAQAD